MPIPVLNTNPVDIFELLSTAICLEANFNPLAQLQERCCVFLSILIEQFALHKYFFSFLELHHRFAGVAQ